MPQLLLDREQSQPATLLTAEDERRLALIIHGTNEATAKAARDQMAEANLRLVAAIARRFIPYLGSGLQEDDLLQEGYLGLLVAIERFNPDSGRFSTYATWWIRQAIGRALDLHGTMISLPVHRKLKIRKIAKVARQLELDGTPPTAEDLAAQTGLPVELVAQLREEDRRVSPRSLNELIAAASVDEEITLESFISDPLEDTALEGIQQATAHEILEQLDRFLKPRERWVLIHRYGLAGEHQHTLVEVGEQLKLSREMIRQIEMKALRKLRRPEIWQLFFDGPMPEKLIPLTDL